MSDDSGQNGSQKLVYKHTSSQYNRHDPYRHDQCLSVEQTVIYQDSVCGSSSANCVGITVGKNESDSCDIHEQVCHLEIDKRSTVLATESRGDSMPSLKLDDSQEGEFLPQIDDKYKLDESDVEQSLPLLSSCLLVTPACKHIRTGDVDIVPPDLPHHPVSCVMEVL